MITIWETGYHRSRDTNSICVEWWVQAVSCALVLNISPITYYIPKDSNFRLYSQCLNNIGRTWSAVSSLVTASGMIHRGPSLELYVFARLLATSKEFWDLELVTSKFRPSHFDWWRLTSYTHNHRHALYPDNRSFLPQLRISFSSLGMQGEYYAKKLIN